MGTERIVTVPGKLSGQPHIAGTRIQAAAIKALLDRGFNDRTILEMYPDICADDVEAVWKWEPGQWFPRTATHAAAIIDAAREVDAQFPRGLLECWGEGTVTISVASARKLREVLRE